MADLTARSAAFVMILGRSRGQQPSVLLTKRDLQVQFTSMRSGKCSTSMVFLEREIEREREIWSQRQGTV